MRERGQASVETIALTATALALAIALGVGVVRLAPPFAAALARALSGGRRPAPRPTHPASTDSSARCSPARRARRPTAHAARSANAPPGAPRSAGRRRGVLGDPAPARRARARGRLDHVPARRRGRHRAAEDALDPTPAPPGRERRIAETAASLAGTPGAVYSVISDLGITADQPSDGIAAGFEAGDVIVQVRGGGYREVVLRRQPDAGLRVVLAVLANGGPEYAHGASGDAVIPGLPTARGATRLDWRAGTGVRRVRGAPRNRGRPRRLARPDRRAAARVRAVRSVLAAALATTRGHKRSRCPTAADIADVQSALLPGDAAMTPDAALLALERRHGREAAEALASAVLLGVARSVRAVARQAPDVSRLDPRRRRSIREHGRNRGRPRRRGPDGIADRHVGHRRRPAPRDDGRHRASHECAAPSHSIWRRGARWRSRARRRRRDTAGARPGDAATASDRPGAGGDGVVNLFNVDGDAIPPGVLSGDVEVAWPAHRTFWRNGRIDPAPSITLGSVNSPLTAFDYWHRVYLRPGSGGLDRRRRGHRRMTRARRAHTPLAVRRAERRSSPRCPYP